MGLTKLRSSSPLTFISLGIKGLFLLPILFFHLQPSCQEGAGKTGPIALEEVAHVLPNGSEENAELPHDDRLVRKADTYFHKMRYAEAAELYEEVLAQDGKDLPYDILQKAGDAHYFNTNMERAHFWYNILFEQHQDRMRPNDIFKYAHSSKGVGKYNRSKKLMRLYSRTGRENLSLPLEGELGNPTPEEVELDNIIAKVANFEIKNLDVNSKYSDFAPSFYHPDEIVFASAKDSSFLQTRLSKWNNQPYLDLYISKIDKESQALKRALKFSKTINTRYHEAAVAFSTDNKTMYFTRNNFGKKLTRATNGINHLKIYMSTNVDGKWTEAEELPFNSNEYSAGHPALSPDGKQLYFISDMPGSLGDTDIFVVDILGKGQFSSPRNLGPEINTEGKEMFPFMTDKKLYFSSNGHVGLGGLDIFEVPYGPDGFMPVKNVGQPINSNRDDLSFIIDEVSQQGYFSSNRPGGKGDDDLYSFTRLAVEEVVHNTSAISGTVTERISGTAMPQTLVSLLDKNNIKLKETVTDDSGNFVFEDLEGNTQYYLHTQKPAFVDGEATVKTGDNEKVAMDITLKRLEELVIIENGIKKLKANLVHFNFDAATINENAARELERVVSIMKEYPNMVIKIQSHTDAIGNSSYNKYLSDRRAQATKGHLLAAGIAAERIESAIGYGEEQLLNDCRDGADCSAAQNRLNRRSEIIIVSM